MNQIFARLSLATTLALSLVAVGCNGPDDDDAESIATSAAALSAGLSTDGLDRVSSADPAQAAGEAAAADPDDKGCRTRRVDPNDASIVYVTLRSCTKRFGRHVLDGELKLTFSAGRDGALHVERESLSLTVDGRPATHRASVDITFAGDQRVAKARGTWQHTRDDGALFTRMGEHTITVDRATGCRVSEGTSIAQLDGDQVGTGTSNLAWCKLPDGSETCPVGLVEHDRPAKNKHVTKTFDGTTSAKVEITTRRGTRNREIALVCTPR